MTPVAMLVYTILLFGFGIAVGWHAKPGYETHVDLQPDPRGGFTFKTYARKVQRGGDGRIEG